MGAWRNGQREVNLNVLGVNLGFVFGGPEFNSIMFCKNPTGTS